MRNLLAFVAAVAAFTLLAGCGGKSVVGKWDLSMSSTEPQANTMLQGVGTLEKAIEFKSDDTFAIEMMGQKLDGTYKMESNEVTLAPKGANAVGFADKLTMSDDGDKLTGANGAVTFTFTRAKE